MWIIPFIQVHIISSEVLSFCQDQQEATKKAAAQKREVERKRKTAELELVKQGKTPYYLKKCEFWSNYVRFQIFEIAKAF